MGKISVSFNQFDKGRFVTPHNKLADLFRQQVGNGTQDQHLLVVGRVIRNDQHSLSDYNVVNGDMLGLLPSIDGETFLLRSVQRQSDVVVLPQAPDKWLALGRRDESVLPDLDMTDMLASPNDISREQLHFALHKDTWYVKQVSKNVPTLINRRLLRLEDAPRALAAGDEITFGNLSDRVLVLRLEKGSLRQGVQVGWLQNSEKVLNVSDDVSIKEIIRHLKTRFGSLDDTFNLVYSERIMLLTSELLQSSVGDMLKTENQKDVYIALVSLVRRVQLELYLPSEEQAVIKRAPADALELGARRGGFLPDIDVYDYIAAGRDRSVSRRQVWLRYKDGEWSIAPHEQAGTTMYLNNKPLTRERRLANNDVLSFGVQSNPSLRLVTRLSVMT